MSDSEQGTNEAPSAATPNVAADSVLGRLRVIREQAAEQTTVTLPAPGLPGVELRMRALPDAQRRRIQKQMVALQDRGADDIGIAADVVATATVEILVTEPDGGLTQPLVDDEGPVGFDHRLAALLGIEAESARDVVFAFWPQSDRTAWQLISLSGRYLSWLSGSDDDLEGELLGN